MISKLVKKCVQLGLMTGKVCNWQQVLQLCVLCSRKYHEQVFITNAVQQLSYFWLMLQGIYYNGNCNFCM